VNVDGALTYVAAVTFQEAEYVSEALQFGDGELTKSLEVTVYDSTTEDTDIRVVNAHTVFMVEPEFLRVQEVYVIANMSDRTYIGKEEVAAGQRKTLEFDLPSGFSELELGGGVGTIVASNGGFADTSPVQPGGREVFYSYRVSLESSEYTYSRTINYLTLRYSLLVQGDRVSIKSEQLSAQDPTSMGNLSFAGMVGSDLAAGSSVVAEISGLSSGGSGGFQSPLLWVGAAIVVAVGIVAALTVVRRKRAVPATVTRDEDEEGRLLAEIAQLDDDFEAGKIGEESYLKVRAEMKTGLAEVMRRAGGLKTGG
jgi:hypothetical protein